MNYDEIKDSLVIKAINVEENQTLLEEIPHKIVGDIAIIYQIIGFDEHGEIDFVEINNEFMIENGIDIDTLHNDAIKSSENIFPPLIKPIEEMLGLEPDSCEVKVYVITNEYCTNGACSIFYPELLSKLSEKVGHDLYIIPSSIDECIAVYDMKKQTPEDVEEMLRYTNITDLVGNKKLSDSLYHYDAKEHILERNSDYEKRINKEESNEQNMDDYDITDEFE